MNMNSYSCCKKSSQEYSKIESISALLKLVSETSRLKILCILRQGPHCVCEIIEHVSLSQSLISHHLKDLKNAGLVSNKKMGLRVYYSVTPLGKQISDLIFII